MDKASATEVFPYMVIGSVMIGTESDKLNKFLKMKPPTFFCFEIENVFKFIVDCYERL